MLPPFALKRGPIILLHGIADAEVADEAPLLWDVEHRCHARRIKYRDPTHAEPFSAGSKPECVDCDSDRVVKSFRHGLSSKTGTLRRRVIREDGNLAGGIVEPCEF